MLANTSIDLTQWPCPIEKEKIVINLRLEGEPVSKSRARMGRYGNFYTPEKTNGYEKFLKWNIRAQLGNKGPDPDSFFGVRALFYRSNRQRIDCDNLMKSVFDAGNDLIYKDDKQVSEEFGKLFLADPNPRIEFVVYVVDDTSPKRVCHHCKSEFVRSKSVKSVYCSMKCRNESKHITKTCEWCKSSFSLPMSVAKATAAKYCTKECAVKGNGRRKTMLRGPGNWKCGDCGGYVTRREYRYCKSCSMKRRGDPTSNYYKLRH